MHTLQHQVQLLDIQLEANKGKSDSGIYNWLTAKCLDIADLWGSREPKSFILSGLLNHLLLINISLPVSSGTKFSLE